MSMIDDPRQRRVTIGVDTHKHVAVALDDIGGLIESRSFAADASGYDQLIDWATGLGKQVTSESKGQDPTGT